MAGIKKDATPTSEVDALKAQIEALNKQLENQGAKLTAAEESARLAVEGQGGVPFMQNTMQEIPTGKTVTVRRAKNPWVRKTEKIEYEDVELPTFYYKIDLPASGGVDIKINGESKYHGQTYELTLDDLRTVKDMVARAWGHEANIRGSNENVFRRPQNRVLSGKAN